MMDWLSEFQRLAWAIMVESAPWVLLSLLIGGLIHEFLPATRLSAALSRRGAAGMIGAVAFGAMLPVCSCGVIPLAVSLYRSGVRIGAVVAFAAATPMINPAAVVLSLALLGPELTVAYVLLGLLLPLGLGVLAERWSHAPPTMILSGPTGEARTAAATANGRRIFRGAWWGITALGPSIAFYLAAGVLVAAAVMATIPSGWIDAYLGDGGLLGLLTVGAFGAVIYVCAVAHIPVVATLLAAGAAPGAAIVFLVTGAATNLPELVALYHAIGRRTVTIYAVGLVLGSLLAGMLVNAVLLPGFAPVFDPLRSLELMRLGWFLQPSVAGWLGALSALLLVGLAGWGFVTRIRARLLPRAPALSGSQAAGAAPTSCAASCCCHSDEIAPPIQRQG